MQEGWGSGGDDMNLGTSQWEDEEGGMWNNAASQESTSSCSSWGNAPKKGLPKGMKTSGKQDEAWIMSRLMKQLTDMGFPVTGVLFYCSPPCVLPCMAPIVSCPRLSCVTRKENF